MLSTLLPQRARNPITSVATLMLAEAVSLGIASTVHLAGLVHGRASNYNPDAAGTAEAVIGVVLAAAAVIMFRRPARARRFGIAATTFALAGFLVGITETARGGDIPDIAYHATVIPLLTASLVLLVRARPSCRPGSR